MSHCHKTLDTISDVSIWLSNNQCTVSYEHSCDTVTVPYLNRHVSDICLLRVTDCDSSDDVPVLPGYWATACLLLCPADPLFITVGQSIVPRPG